VLNTLLLTGATCAVSVPLGTALGWVLSRTNVPGKSLGMAVVGLLLLVPLYLQTAAWQAGFGLQGWLAMHTGGDGWLEGWPGTIWVHSMAAVPWVALIAGVGFRLVEPKLEEQALLDASERQVFFRVTMPGVLPAVGLAALWVAIFTSGEITVTDMFGVRTYAEELYTSTALGPRLGEGPMAALPGVVLTAVILLGGLVLCGRLMPHNRPLSLRWCRIVRLGRWRWPTAVVVGVFLLLLAGVPLGNLIYKAGVLVTQTDVGRERSWSFVKCVTMTVESPWMYQREFGWSLLIAAVAASVAVVVAVCLAWLARRGGWRSWPALLTAAVCLALPGPLVGIGLIHLLNRDNPLLIYLYDNTITAPFLALLVKSLPISLFVMWHSLASVSREMLDSAAVDGASPLMRMVKVVLPGRLWALAVAWLLAFALALGELGASILVVPPGVETLSIHIFGLLHYGVEDRVAAISLALIGMFSVLGVVVYRLSKK